MNMKPKPGTAQDATKAIRARMQGARGPTQRNIQKRKKQRVEQEKTSYSTTLSKNQDEIRLRTLRRYGKEHRGKAQETNIEQGDEEENRLSLEKPHINSSSEENRNEAARDEIEATREETEEKTISPPQREII